MEDKFRKILSKHPSIPAEKLLAYLDGRLEGAERMEVEMAMIESEFLSDAAEGLEQIGDTKRINSLVEGLNKGLRRKMRRDRRLYRKGDAGFPGWLAFTAIILLMLIIAGFLVLKMMSKG
jgi:hypothetical protein